MPPSRVRVVAAVLAAALLLLIPGEAWAIRPFVTDDARVVGGRLGQVETWALVNRRSLSHNLLFAVGPTRWLELTLGLTHGGVHSGNDRGYSLTGPIAQAKALLHEAQPNGWPGLAVSAGLQAPFGFGPLLPSGLGAFGYLAVTESLFREALLLHANVGVAAADVGAHWTVGVTAGFGFQARVVGGFHAVAEVFYGDPYDPDASVPSTQVGFRYIFSDHVQMDGTFGTSLARHAARGAGDPGTEQWGTLGLRVVSNPLW